MEITVTDVDATFNGSYVITTVPTATTFTYAKKVVRPEFYGKIYVSDLDQI